MIGARAVRFRSRFARVYARVHARVRARVGCLLRRQKAHGETNGPFYYCCGAMRLSHKNGISDIVDTLCHAFGTFVHTPRLGLHFPTSWGKQ